MEWYCTACGGRYSWWNGYDCIDLVCHFIGYTNFGKDVLKRGKRLLLPYFCVMLTWVIPFYVRYSGFNLSIIVYKYVLGCAPSQLWFLPMLFLLFIIFYRVLYEKHLRQLIFLTHTSCDHFITVGNCLVLIPEKHIYTSLFIVLFRTIILRWLFVVNP